MESLKIKTGVVSLRIEDDNGEERGIFRFNPTDVGLAQRVLDMQKDFEVKEKEFAEKEKQCEFADERIALLVEICTYFKHTIDEVFGANSSEILFGDAMTVSMFEDFFTGITPYFENASVQRVSKYTKKPKKSTK